VRFTVYVHLGTGLQGRGDPPILFTGKLQRILYCLLQVTFSELTDLTPRDRDFLYAALRSISDNQRERGCPMLSLGYKGYQVSIGAKRNPGIVI
jgi:hypothetical protein